MGAGAGSQPKGGSKPEKRYQAMQVQHQKLSAAAEKKLESETAPPVKVARGVKEPPLSLHRIATGERRAFPCEKCGNAMGTVATASGGTTLKCGSCMITKANHKPCHEVATIEDSSDAPRRPSKQSLPKDSEVQEWAPLVIPGNWLLKQEIVEDSGPSSRTSSKQSVKNGRAGSKQSVKESNGEEDGEESNGRAGSKQAVLDASSSAGPHSVHRRHSGSSAFLQRRKTTHGALQASDEAMGGLVMGDRVIFDEQDQTAMEFGVGTVQGPTATHGVVNVKFDKHETGKGFNLKADGLRKLNFLQETKFRANAGSNMRRRSTIG